ncbi:MAG: hypothetical protein SPH45_04820, partial [Gemmiger qucibialis]|nr:hypothetical protein [Gemmiger qucibialis]
MKFRKPHFHCTNLLLNVYLKTKKMTDISQTQAGFKAKSRGNPLWIPRAIPHNSKCRYGERGAAAAKPKAQIILDAAKVSAASGGNSEPKQGQR